VSDKELKTLCHRLIQSGVTGLFVNSDTIAARCGEACESHGYSIPDDLSIIGFDDRRLKVGQAQKTLTSIGFDKNLMGQQAVQILRSLVVSEPRLACKSVTATTWVSPQETVKNLLSLDQPGQA
jgi:DNA-binding LacI/PurR family transcriptional regulator